MTAPFIGEIRSFSFNYSPRGWMLCWGQIIAIQFNTTLFSVLGTRYGGNGTTTFALPDLRGVATLGMGLGRGLSAYSTGQKVGTPTVTLTPDNLPPHGHAFQAVNGQATSNAAAGNLLARGNFDDGATIGVEAAFINPTAAGALVPLAPNAIGPSGGNGAHNNMMPYLALNYCIAVVGMYPSRN